MASTSKQDRFTAMTGGAAVGLWAAGVLLIGGGHVGFPGGMPEESAGEVLSFYAADADRVTAGSWAFMLGALCFVWFAVRLTTALASGTSAPATDSAARLATGAGVVTGVLLVLTAAPGLVAALGAEHLEAAAAQALDAVGGVMFVGAEMTGVVMLAALAVLASRAAAMPRAWTFATYALAGWLAVLPVGWVGLIAGVPLWTLATAALLTRRQASPQVAAGLGAGAAPVRTGAPV